ncbi:putative Pak inhibitor skb15 [Hibiscus syriacus]|uniref:Pak inhibitor skb15 n=1 Tax=Hibiscus syriacus TaxID=106335 RepID=A0A6A2ZUF7_HIBSY|nr:putative Pak inhibitor skb15 [Hibiscus syriacus]
MLLGCVFRALLTGSSTVCSGPYWTCRWVYGYGEPTHFGLYGWGASIDFSKRVLPALLQSMDYNHLLSVKQRHLPQIHARFILHGLHQNTVVSSHLTDSYANFGLLNLSLRLFYSDTNASPPLHNTMLRNLMTSLKKLSFHSYEFEQAVLDEKPGGTGKVVHCLILVSDLSKDLYVNTALLSMDSKLGSLKDARLVFENMPEKDLVVWNIMVSANSQQGKSKESVKNLKCMENFGIRADIFTAIPVISFIRQLKSIEWGKQMHAYVMRNGLDYQLFVHNSLIDIMKTDGVETDFITVINILLACVNIGALEQVKALHVYSLKLGRNLWYSVNSAQLIGYAKYGCIVLARKLFVEEETDFKDIITWNSMISARARYGVWSQCFQLYNQMKRLNT